MFPNANMHLRAELRAILNEKKTIQFMKNVVVKSFQAN